jgi:uncharacterized repeat protein (TIGR03943 family)
MHDHDHGSEERDGRMSVAIFGVWCAFFCFIGFSGRLPLYINPRFSFLPILGAALSGAIALTLGLRQLRRGEGETRGDYSLVAWLLMPIVLGILIPPEGVGAFVASKRGGAAVSADSEGVFSSTLQSGGEYASTTLADLTKSSGEKPKKVSVEGQISLDSGKKGECRLTHYVMVCCVADLSPVSVELRYPSGFAPVNGQWVRVRADAHSGPDGVMLDAKFIQPLNQPSSQYLYP